MSDRRDLPDVLRRILANTRDELAERRRGRPLNELRAMAADAPRPRDFAAALTGDEVAIIAEIKRASPSEGAIRAGQFDPAAIARQYDDAGAAALSVLTDERFFGGRLEYLTAAREACALPVLRKDFIVDEYQLYEARAAGADAVLLIVAALPPELLHDLRALTASLQMTALVESHDEVELEVALDAGARAIGVNNRDLRTFEVDLGVTERLAPMVPRDRAFVAESGMHGREDIRRVATAGADAALVGTALMRADDPGEALRGLTGVRRLQGEGFQGRMR
ncbi:MAG: indole-3-glycerol phosphate synthase TrpC [Armatimonadota bacterium]|jgi:indole-3-glycerol phosphate synthase